MIDLHCHILPGVDDGPPDVSAALEMANAAVEAGITHIYATPHHLNGRFENSKVEIIDGAIRINNLFRAENIPLTVHPGQELRIHQELLHSLDRNEVLTLDNNGGYLLLELPSGDVPVYTQDVVYELLLKEITPIIVHPERNRAIIENPEILYNLVQEGALTQVTSGSILGQFSKRVKTFSEKLIEHHLAHFIATDAHNVRARGFSLQHALDSVAAKFGKQAANHFVENAELVMRGQSLHVKQPVQIRKRFMGIF